MLSDLRIIFCVRTVIRNIRNVRVRSVAVCCGSVVICQGSDKIPRPLQKIKLFDFFIQSLRTLVSVALPYLIHSSSVSVLIIRKPILDVLVAVKRPILCAVFLCANLSLEHRDGLSEIRGRSVNPLHDPPSSLAIYHIWNCGLYLWRIRLCVTGPLLKCE